MLCLSAREVVRDSGVDDSVAEPEVVLVSVTLVMIADCSFR